MKHTVLWLMLVGCGCLAQDVPQGAFSNTWSTISVRSLRHIPPKAARKEFEKGMRLWEKRWKEAGPHFARAAALDREYASAHEMLGIHRAKSGQMDAAVESLARAIELEPDISDFQANMGMLFIGRQGFAAAEPYARRAVRLMPSNNFARLVLGLALVGQEQATPEAAASLRGAVEAYPAALPALRWVEARLR